MPKKSAGILLFRFRENLPEVLLVHPGGPFYAKRDTGSWSVPKGEFEPEENPLHAAIREMEEETGILVSGDLIELSPVKQKSGKLIFAWALLKDIDPAIIKSNEFELEWPPKSSMHQSFPEIDKAGWFTIPEARIKIIAGQIPIIEELQVKLDQK